MTSSSASLTASSSAAVSGTYSQPNIESLKSGFNSQQLIICTCVSRFLRNAYTQDAIMNFSLVRLGFLSATSTYSKAILQLLPSSREEHRKFLIAGLDDIQVNIKSIIAEQRRADRKQIDLVTSFNKTIQEKLEEHQKSDEAVVVADLSALSLTHKKELHPA